MAVSQDEWKGELTRFLDRLPLRPCISPPAPSFCTVCGRLNGQVASSCKFYPLRFERQLGRTTVEPALFMGRRDTFEIDVDFEEEEEFSDAPMIEFERPERVPVPRTVPIARAIPVDREAGISKPSQAHEAEVEVVEAELVEVVEEPMEEPIKESGAPAEPAPLAATPAPREAAQTMEDSPVPPDKMTVIAPIYPQPKLKILAGEKHHGKAEERPLPPPPPDFVGPIHGGAIHSGAVKESPTTQPEAPTETPETPLVSQIATPSSPLEAATPKPVEPTEKPAVPQQDLPLTLYKAPSPEPESLAPEKAPSMTPTPPPVPATGRRTGGLYDI